MASPTFTLTETNTHPPKDRTILITGGASGIGLAAVQYLHGQGNNVVALDRASHPSSVQGLRQSPRFLYLECDILDWTSQRSAFGRAATFYGGIDAVWVNAGLAEYGEQLWTDVKNANGELKEPDRRTIDVDIRAVGDTLKLAFYYLRNDRDPKTGNQRGSGKGRGGSVVMTASIAGYLASAGAPLYSAAKHGVVGYLRALKSDCKTAGIAISVVAPGITATPILLGARAGQTYEDWARELRERGVPVNTPQTIALLVAHIIGLGMEANGNGYMIQNNVCQELEAGIAKNRAQWMGKEMLAMFRGGRNVPMFPNKL